MTIALDDILCITAPTEYKLHLASQAEDGTHPLDEYVMDPANWKGWNEYRGKKNEWNRPRVLSFMEFYPKADAWLFGGVWEVVKRHAKRYELALVKDFNKYVGRLIVSFHRYQGMRGRAFKLDTYYDQMTVAEMLPEPYAGESFPGLENINHDFSALAGIFKRQRKDWKAALSSVKGIYLIVDTSNGKKYVGSAYAQAGFWSRWACYIGTGHGWNDELVKLIKQKGQTYALKNFRLSVLEYMAKATPKDLILEREAHWKRALFTRKNEHGYNANWTRADRDQLRLDLRAAHRATGLQDHTRQTRRLRDRY